MATGGLYGDSGTGALIAQPGAETPGLYGKSPNGSSVATTGSETGGLYGNTVNFGGSYFEWFIFQQGSTQPTTPTGGSWNFVTNVGTPPSGWLQSPPSAPTNQIWVSIAFVNSKDPTNITWSTPGLLGVVASTNVGTTTTGTAGSSASVTNSGTSLNAVLNFTIPRGDTGATGTAATIAVGTTTTTAPGTNATVTNSGTSAAAVFNFGIPKGAGVIAGGTAGQYLAKASGTDYDTVWSTITGTLAYQGAWNASTNSPTLTSSVGTNGYYYVVSVAGSTNLNGVTDWQIGDWAIFNGTIWQKLDQTNLVTSVAGRTGAVVLSNTDISGLGTMSTQNANTVAITGGSAALSTLKTLGLTGYLYGNDTSAVTASTTIPTSALSGNFVSTFSAGTTGLTPNTNTAGAITLGGTLAVANGGTGVTSSSGANSVVLRDANANISVNCLFEGYATVAASGTTIVLTASSAQNYQITGSGGQVIRLPNATTLPNGALFTFNNNQSSGAITVQNNSSTTVATINSGGFVTIVLLDNTLAAGSWDRHDQTPANVSWSTNTFDYPGSITSATWNGSTIAINRGGTNGTATPTAGAIAYGTGTAYGFTSAGTSGQVLTSSGTGVPTWTTPTTGTVTSVTGTSPVVSSGGATPAISLATSYGDTQNPYASKTANYVLAAPNGTAGAPTFRAIVAADIPTLNQNTTGTASNVTGIVAIANGGTGQTIASSAFNALSPVTSTGDLIVGNGVNSATRLAIGTNGYVLTSNGTTATWAASTGGVTSFSAGSTGLTPNTATTGAVSLAGTLAIANGGTGQTTATAAFDALAPSQTSNSGKYLTTNGTTTSWATVSGSGATITNDITTSSNVYPLFAAATSGTPTTVYTSNAKYLYKPSTGELSATAHVNTNGISITADSVSSSYTIATGTNGFSVGPLTINSGVVLTIASGQRHIVI